MRILLSLLFLVVAIPSHARRQFDIEVIIFKRITDAEQTTESWPNVLPKIELKHAGYLNDANYRSRKSVILMGKDQLELKEQAQRLDEHAGFELLLHTGWRQSDRNTPTFHIQAGRDFSDEFNPDGSQRIQERQANAFNNAPVPYSFQPVYELDGKLRVFVDHYLYADVTLDLKAPNVREVTLQPKVIDFDFEQRSNSVQIGFLEDITPTLIKERFLKPYRMDQKRRMRSSETHFLDHPLLGIVIQTRRVE